MMNFPDPSHIKERFCLTKLKQESFTSILTCMVKKHSNPIHSKLFGTKRFPPPIRVETTQRIHFVCYAILAYLQNRVEF